MDNKSNKTKAGNSASAPKSVERNSEENQKNSANEQVTIIPLSGSEIVHDKSSERTYLKKAEVVPVNCFKNDDPDKSDSKSPESQGFVITEATKVEDILVAEAEKIDPEKEKIEREQEVKEVIRKERENIFKNNSARRRNKLKIIFSVVTVLAVTALFIGIAFTGPPPVPVSAPTKPYFPPVMDLRGDNIKIEKILDDGRSFHVPVADFMFPFDSISPDENGKIKSSLRVFNSRKNTIKAIMVEKIDDMARGWYNPADSGQPDDFQVGDILSAIDYRVFTEQTCNRVPFIVEFPTSFEMERDATNINIGHEGIVGAGKGNVFQDFDVLVEVAGPVSKLWTDAVNSHIEILQQGSWANWPQKVSSDNKTSSIHPFPEHLSGKFRVTFKDVAVDDLNGLVSKLDGGGLHMAVCT